MSQMTTNMSRLSFPHSRHITEFVARVTRRIPLVKQELLRFPAHLRSSPVVSGVHDCSIFIFSVAFRRSLFVLLSFSLCPCIIFPSLIYGF